MGLAFGKAGPEYGTVMPELEERPGGKRSGGVTSGGQAGVLAPEGRGGTLVTGKGRPMAPLSVEGVSLTGIWNR